jgi:hypothetical protein
MKIDKIQNNNIIIYKPIAITLLKVWTSRIKLSIDTYLGLELTLSQVIKVYKSNSQVIYWDQSRLF